MAQTRWQWPRFVGNCPGLSHLKPAKDCPLFWGLQGRSRFPWRAGVQAQVAISAGTARTVRSAGVDLPLLAGEALAVVAEGGQAGRGE